MLSEDSTISMRVFNMSSDELTLGFDSDLYLVIPCQE